MEDTARSGARRADTGHHAQGVSLADLIDEVPAILYVDVLDDTIQAGHRTIMVSHGVEMILGYTPSEIVDEPDQWLRIVHPDDRADVITRTLEHLARPSIRSSEYRVIRRDGRVLTVRDDCTAQIDPVSGKMVSRGVITDITALRQSETQFQQFLERLPIVAYTESPVDSEPFLYIGPQIEALTGYRPAEFFADDRLFERLVHPDDRGRQLAGYGDPGAPYLAEYRLMHRDGRTVWVRDRAVTELDADGAVTAIHGFLIDVTAEREATTALADAGARYQSLVENLPLITYLALAEPTPSGDQTLLYVSPQIEAVFGYPASRFTDDPSFQRQIVHPDDVEWVYEQWLLDPRAPQTTEYRILAADGRVVWVRDITVTVPGSAGGPDVRQGTLTDITEARAAREALAAAEERYRTLVEGLPLVTYIDRLDKHRPGDFPSAFISPQVERVLGVKPEAFQADPLLWRRLVHPDDRERAFVRHEPGESVEDVLEYRMIRADGATIWVRDGSRVLHDADGPTAVQGYVLDITEAKRAEEALIRAQKLESLGDLAGGIAHDFNNLLVSILGNAELALMDLPADDDARDSIVQIEVAARRAADLARQMLAYSGRGQFVVAPIAVNELVSEIVDLLRVAIGKGVGLSWRLADGLPAVEADATQLRQVVMNIVVNASDAIGSDDGRITIATEHAHLGRAEIAALYGTADLTPGEYVVIEVSDTGPGMDPATLRRIFDPFFTTKFAGRGLGLAAVLGIVSGHRGGIAVESERGRGSRFRIYLPSTARPVPVGAAPQPTTGGRDGTVLIADDDPSVRSVARRMLERMGWTVEEVGNGALAVERVETSNGDVDAVLLDLTMPVLDGAGAFLRIHELRPNLPVVLMSGYTETDAIQRFGDAGLAGFVQKPFTPAELSRALDEAIARAPGD